MENIEIILRNMHITEIESVLTESILFNIKDIKTSHFFDKEKNKDISYHEVGDLKKYFLNPGTCSIFLEKAMVGAEFENVLLLIASDGQSGDITINLEESRLMKESNQAIDKKVQKLLALLLGIYQKDVVKEVILGYEPADDDDMMILRVARKQIEMLNKNAFDSQWACSVYNLAKHMKL